MLFLPQENRPQPKAPVLPSNRCPLGSCPCQVPGEVLKQTRWTQGPLGAHAAGREDTCAKEATRGKEMPGWERAQPLAGQPSGCEHRL